MHVRSLSTTMRPGIGWWVGGTIMTIIFWAAIVLL